MTTSLLPVWRSLLFVPVTARRFVDGAARRGADAIILDLEDSVAASEKERARALVPEVAEIVSRGGADVVVRINRPLRLAVRDIETESARASWLWPCPRHPDPARLAPLGT
jgi:citrate lyase subunit beta/citryl-CoA lyase